MGAALFFTALAAAGIAACFPLGLAAPIFHLFRLFRAGVLFPSQGHALGDLVQRAAEQSLPAHLCAAHRSFAIDTRSLLADLEHAHAHAYRFSSSPGGGWWQQLVASQSHSTYASTIGITGEVWRWLRHAEALLDNVSEPPSAQLEPVTKAVRAMLFDARPLSEHLQPLATLVGRVDAGLRTQTSAPPYRDRLPVPAPAQPEAATPAPSPMSADESRRRYEHALSDSNTAIRAIVRRFSEPADHADLFQDIRLAVWKALPAYRGDSSIRSYVLRIARYRAITFRERKVVLEGERIWRDAAPEPDEHLDRLRQRRALAHAIDNLPGNLRLALELRLAGATYREIGEQLAITEKNASVRVSRARTALKRRFCTEG